MPGWASAVLVPTRRAGDLFVGWWQLIASLGAVPRVLVWDAEGAVGRWRGRRSELSAECQGFRGTLATKVVICRPADPEAKGLVERLHDYLERSFLPGRSFTSPADFNAQLQSWLATANTRRYRVLGCAPADRIGADRAAMISLPPVPPVTGWRLAVRLPRDHYVRLDTNDYSVHPAVIGRRIEVTADLHRVRAALLQSGTPPMTCGDSAATDHLPHRWQPPLPAHPARPRGRRPVHQDPRANPRPRAGRPGPTATPRPRQTHPLALAWKNLNSALDGFIDHGLPAA